MLKSMNVWNCQVNERLEWSSTWTFGMVKFFSGEKVGGCQHRACHHMIRCFPSRIWHVYAYTLFPVVSFAYITCACIYTLFPVVPFTYITCACIHAISSGSLHVYHMCMYTRYFQWFPSRMSHVNAYTLFPVVPFTYVTCACIHAISSGSLHVCHMCMHIHAITTSRVCNKIIKHVMKLSNYC